MTGVLLALALLGFSGGVLAATRSFTHPAVLYGAVWAVVYALWGLDSFTHVAGYYPVSVTGHLLLVAGHIAFALGCAVPSTARKVRPFRFYSVEHRMGTRLTAATTTSSANCLYDIVAMLLFVLSATGTIMYWIQVVRAIGLPSTGIAVFLREWNYGVAFAQIEFGGLPGRLMTLAQLAVPYNLWAYNMTGRRRWYYLALALLELIFLVGPRRGPLIRTLLSAAALYGLSRWGRVVSSRRVLGLGLTVGVTILSLFAPLQVMLNKAAPGAGSALLSAYHYIAGNIPAFLEQVRLVEMQGLTYGGNTFNVPIGVLAKLGLAMAPDLSVPFVHVPVKMNTIPYVFYFYRDFGVMGILLGSWLFGMGASVAYHHRSRGFLGAYLYATMIVTILLSFRQMFLVTYEAWTLVLSATVLSAIVRPRFAVRAQEAQWSAAGTVSSRCAQ